MNARVRWDLARRARPTYLFLRLRDLAVLLARSVGAGRDRRVVRPAPGLTSPLAAPYGRAVRAYVPGCYDGDVTLVWFRDDDSPDPADPAARLRPLVGCVTVTEVAGDFVSAMRSGLAEVADALAEVLARAR